MRQPTAASGELYAKMRRENQRANFETSRQTNGTLVSKIRSPTYHTACWAIVASSKTGGHRTPTFRRLGTDLDSTRILREGAKLGGKSIDGDGGRLA